MSFETIMLVPVGEHILFSTGHWATPTHTNSASDPMAGLRRTTASVHQRALVKIPVLTEQMEFVQQP